MKYFQSALQHNKLTSSIIKKLIPKEARIKIYNFLNEDIVS